MTIFHHFQIVDTTESAGGDILIERLTDILSAITERLVMTELTDMSHSCGNK